MSFLLQKNLSRIELALVGNHGISIQKVGCGRRKNITASNKNTFSSGIDICISKTMLKIYRNSVKVSAKSTRSWIVQEIWQAK